MAQATSSDTVWITPAEAKALTHGTNGMLRAWLQQDRIRALRIGPRKVLYDRDSILAMVQPLGRLTDHERSAIAKLVADAPEPTDEQIARLRSIIHGTALLPAP